LAKAQVLVSDYTEDTLIEQPAIALFGGDLLLPKLILGEVDVSDLDIAKGV
jgi:hypothetical protein